MAAERRSNIAAAIFKITEHCEIIGSAEFEHKTVTSVTRNVENLSARSGDQYMAERKKVNTPLCISITVDFVYGLLYPIL